MHPLTMQAGQRPADARCKMLITNKLVAGSTGLEPAASGVTGRRSNQLNYDPARVLMRNAVVPIAARCSPHSASMALPGAWWAVQDSNL